MQITFPLPFAITLLVALSLPAPAQVYTPPPEPQPSSASALPQDNSPAPRQQPTGSPLGEEIPMLDPSAETITVGGVEIPLGDNRLLKARFEKYLNQPPENGEAAMEYRETIEEILATISPFNESGPELKEAFKLLPRASTYPGDANLCLSLAESIYMALLAKKDVRQLKDLNESMEKEKREIIREADWDARTDRDSTLGNTRAVGDGTGGSKQQQQPRRRRRW